MMVDKHHRRLVAESFHRRRRKPRSCEAETPLSPPPPQPGEAASLLLSPDRPALPCHIKGCVHHEALVTAFCSSLLFLRFNSKAAGVGRPSSLRPDNIPSCGWTPLSGLSSPLGCCAACACGLVHPPGVAPPGCAPAVALLGHREHQSAQAA